MRSLSAFVLLTGCCSLLVSPAAAGELPAAKISFSRQIRPILSDKCFKCHGPDDKHRESGLRLDLKEGAFAAAESGKLPLVAGQAEKSELYLRITHKDPDERMPPADADKQLTAAEVDLIKQWIIQGAEWEQHWAFAPPTRPELPPVKQAGWPKTPIDRFILSRLESEGLSPSPEAERITLLRRVTFDLTGLPPTPEEAAAFLADKSPEAYERVVDRLLRSPRYGEHMARFWLDVARYGDTHGLHLDNYREMWPYRDWVVRAFNQNMPYDEFTVEQLAGDLLPNATLDQQVATGFNRCHVTTNEGGSIAEEVYVRNVVDRVVTTGTVFMGMTLECSRCHDHKYDPFTMTDFYSLFAFFNSLDGGPMDGNKKDPAPVVSVPTPEQSRLLAEYDKQIAALEAKLSAPLPEVDKLQTAWEEQLKQQAAAEGQPKLAVGEWYTVGPFSDNRRYLNNRKHGPEGKPVNLEQEFKSGDAMLKWVRRSDWEDGKPHTDLPGDSACNFLYRKITVDEPQIVGVSLGSDDGIKVYLNDKQVLHKDVARGVAPDQEKIELKLVKGDNHLLIKIMNYGGAAGFYFALKSGLEVIPGEVLEVVKQPPQERNDAGRAKVRDYFRNKVAKSKELDAIKAELAAARKARTDTGRNIPTTLVFRETKAPKQAYMLKRGEYDQRGAEVSRRTPTALPPMKPDLPLNRLGVARWLVDPGNPLTARVAVNRFWLQVFGIGIVKTAEDFGSQGELPSHPELLDWLAVDFVESGWDVKHLMKQLVMSAAYRQSSDVTPKLFERDPQNRLLAHGPRFRLDAEMLRDQALYVSGLLVEKQGGPSVKPPQPDGLWFAVGYSGSNTVRFKADQGPEKVHRRTLYTFIKRTAPPPEMSTFDAPSREACTMRRERTNTPLQALLLLNDPQYFEAAQALARRAMREASEPAQRAARMFELCTSRAPVDEELKDLLADYQDHLKSFQERADDAKKVIGSAADPKFDPSEAAAWTMVANLILNLDEVISKN